LNSDILFLAVPKSAVLELFEKYYAQVPKETLWVNICTFITLKDIQGLTGDARNVVSCKIIGHFEMMSPANKCAFVIHDESPAGELTSIVESVFRKVGIVVHDNEEKYLEVNYIAASEGMKGVIRAANILKGLHIDTQIINAAIRQLFIGTARQFPYPSPDYFHNLVYQRNPGLKELNDEILKIFQ
jgi:pyrroline-5-carboxylate reductase